MGVGDMTIRWLRSQPCLLSILRRLKILKAGCDTWKQADAGRVEIRQKSMSFDELQCDFCSAVPAEEPTRIYQRRKETFLFNGEMFDGDNWIDDGSWKACRDCTQLIENKWWPALRARCLSGFLVRNKIPETTKHLTRYEKEILFILLAVFGEQAGGS